MIAGSETFTSDRQILKVPSKPSLFALAKSIHYTIPRFSQVSTWTSWRKSVDTAANSAWTSKVAVLETYLLKSNEGKAPWSREIFQTFVWWRGSLCPPPMTMQTSAKFRDFAKVYLCSFKCIIFKLGKLPYFKAFFLEMDIPELVLIKTWK